MSKDGTQPFFLRRDSDLPKLESWLKGRRYNCHTSGNVDRKGNPMIGLGYDTDPDNDWKLPQKAGLVVVTKHGLLGKAEAIVERNCK